MRLLASLSLAPLVAAAGQEGAPPHGVPEPPATVTVCRVSRGSDECGQFTIDAWLKEVAEKWLQMKEGSCGALGYEEPMGSRSTALPVLGGQANLTLFKKADPLASLKKAGQGALDEVLARAMGLPTAKLPVCCRSCEEGQSKYYEVSADKGLCSETCMTLQAALVARFFEPSLVSADDGASCASLGYEVYNGTVARGPGVNADVYEWGTKPAEAEEGWTTIYRAQGVECFQATCPSGYAHAAVDVAGFTEGRCSNAGFTEEQDAQVPGFLTGEVRLTLFKKPGELSLADALRFTKDLLETAEEGGGEGPPKDELGLAGFLV